MTSTPCQDKRKYRTGASARADLQRIRRRGIRNDEGVKPVREYQCYLCGHWHLTSSPA